MALFCPPPLPHSQHHHRHLLHQAEFLQLPSLSRPSVSFTGTYARVMASTTERETTSFNKSFSNEEKEKSKTPYVGPKGKSVVVGCGAISVDYLASVARFPQPDEKIRSTDFKVQGGGNAGNALTAVARLGLQPRLISKVAADAFGKLLIDELKNDGVDTSFIVESETGNSSFTYVIVDRGTNTRTCINSPAYPPLIPQELPNGAVDLFFQEARILYLDGRLPETALLLAKEANRQGIPILVDAERKREGLDELLPLAQYVVCSEKFPQAWTEASSLPEALVEMALKLPNLSFVIVTLGALGCIMFERCSTDPANAAVLDANSVIESLEREREDRRDSQPFVITSKIGLLKTSRPIDSNHVLGRFLVGTAETIPAAELVDTTGSGDAFIGAVIYALCTRMPPEKMLPFGASVAAANCRALGARGGLPYQTDPRLIPYLKLAAV